MCYEKMLANSVFISRLSIGVFFKARSRADRLIAQFGSTLTIDGVYDSGEWDDALIVKADSVELFRIKHDSENLYFAVRAGGGDLVFNMDGGVRILHWSAQLGSAEYVKSGTSAQVLDKPFAYELWGLQDEPPAVIHKVLAEYLANNGWTANTASMGNLCNQNSRFRLSGWGWTPNRGDSWRYRASVSVPVS